MSSFLQLVFLLIIIILAAKSAAYLGFQHDQTSVMIVLPVLEAYGLDRYDE